MSTRSGRAVLASLSLVALGLLSACGGETAGSPAAGAPTPAESSGSSAAEPDSGAPAVADPIDTASFEADPCVALSGAAASGLGLKDTGRKRSTGGGAACSWDYSEVTTGRLTIIALTRNSKGLGTMYEQKEQLAYFEEAEIAGHPAVYAGPTDDRTQGRCELYVGLSEKLALQALTQIDQGPDKPRSCQVAEKLADSAMQTLKGGS
ncbi:hypothetical protein CFN78_13960 [Amycolatopsis antarctica]|uniref:DUF3558 domain-containing protein n=1 Tax=Amycolatopsis antarctica TaxID=1854586 RepID=A0A263D2N4_9PSEU|nr:DUF3558 domain-containing protein [Amycolatopsis antarctica]OZM72723.1 hypothetical protein CFN78_13960 [Amycolatopsis antarctica]